MGIATYGIKFNEMKICTKAQQMFLNKIKMAHGAPFGSNTTQYVPWNLNVQQI